MTARLNALLGDITREDVDVIVNAANRALARGGGVCGAIFAAAGPELDDACAALGGCATGDAKVTPAFRLPAHHIAHAVGPVWQGGASREAELLASCYRRALQLAGELSARTIAFPAISTGIFGYPLDEATRIAVRTVRDEVTRKATIEEVRFVCFDERTLAAYREVLAQP
jgi:O-acetyl-ADP-ribose deacetylase (regulator of RNase III)